ncbi:LysR family transcriptional regulator [Myxococcus llanfairpwllgwyngyllgogerychwyrndrobwllllantysiliogogogochensis]|uniref:LysR family transcriptional regulator n=1 Tax=Myxococcus llanfairpwllgwyngyllgogerychwyrndrobwllllantysiliogogogochensis TaxID=2590453 RepID=A0A540WWL2_9BACT|nr:LysR family transcriptional regulator [Myxococcus llanfairpwllgwyngyllgogerychwyrndrobwllllantysiliogogogochensis]TQF13396.1 LysR family transcriptional regulator [Myxococcus llanfairpwllgwyngyllgogerychwyrndrobwllllantysiliogogogochensis]
MNAIYEKSLDLNLLRVFVVVAELGSVTAAAARLYLTQPAVSAALRRLTSAVGSPLFVRDGRGLVLSARGRRLLASARPHLEALVEAALAPLAFDPRTSERTVRLGLSDASESWLLPRLLQALASEAPHLKLVVLPVQFRTVGGLLSASAVDLAVTVADELPSGMRRLELFTEHFTCLHDARRLRLGKTLTLERYLAQEHVIVSYNGDLRGVVEDVLGHQRRVRVSIPTFHGLGALLENSTLVATVPGMVARDVVALRPFLRQLKPPFTLRGAPMELLWRSASEDDEAIRFVHEQVVSVVRSLRRAS